MTEEFLDLLKVVLSSLKRRDGQGRLIKPPNELHRLVLLMADVVKAFSPSLEGWEYLKALDHDRGYWVNLVIRFLGSGPEPRAQLEHAWQQLENAYLGQRFEHWSLDRFLSDLVKFIQESE